MHGKEESKEVEIDMDTDTQNRKYTAISSMIKSPVQFLSKSVLSC